MCEDKSANLISWSECMMVEFREKHLQKIRFWEMEG